MNNDMNLNNQQNNQQYQNVNNMGANDMNPNMSNNQPNYSNYQNYNNQSQVLPPQQSPKKNNNIVKVVLIVLAIIVGIFIVVKIFGGSTTGGGNVGTGKEAPIKNKAYNMTISVGDVQRGVVYTNNGSLLDGTYTKVKVTIKNNDSKELEINSYIVPMNLMDSSKNKITYCSYGSSIQDEKLANETLQDKIPANSVISGYVYCKTDSNSGTILNVNVPSSASTNDTGGYTINLDEYYFTLN